MTETDKILIRLKLIEHRFKMDQLISRMIRTTGSVEEKIVTHCREEFHPQTIRKRDYA